MPNVPEYACTQADGQPASQRGGIKINKKELTDDDNCIHKIVPETAKTM